MMRYKQGSESTEQREQGFLETLEKDFPGVKVLETIRDLGRLHGDRERWAAAVSCYESALMICTDEGMRALINRDLANARARKK